MILTHVLRWFGDCKMWVWEYLTPREWTALGHIANGTVAIGLVCGGAAAVRPLVPYILPPTPIESPSPFAQERVVGGGQSAPVNVPEPWSAGLLVAGVAALAWVRR